MRIVTERNEVCPKCGSDKLRVKNSFTVGLKPVRSGKTVSCSKCNWSRYYAS